jgi:hypothetical protein
MKINTQSEIERREQRRRWRVEKLPAKKTESNSLTTRATQHYGKTQEDRAKWTESV